jgi:hypothetical protein
MTEDFYNNILKITYDLNEQLAKKINDSFAEDEKAKALFHILSIMIGYALVPANEKLLDELFNSMKELSLKTRREIDRHHEKMPGGVM